MSYRMSTRVICYNSDSDEDFLHSKEPHFISNSGDEDKKNVLQVVTCKQPDSTIIEIKIWENDSTSVKLFPCTKLKLLLQPAARTGDNLIGNLRHFILPTIFWMK